MSQKLSIKVPETSANKFTFRDLKISKIEPKLTRIQNIVLESFDANIKPSIVRLQDVKVGLALEFYLDYTIGICIWFFGEHCWGWSDRASLGTLNIPKIGVHDMDLTMDKIPFHLNQISVGPMNATIQPIMNFNLGAPAQANGIKLRNMQIPADWFTLMGIGLGGMITKNAKVSSVKSELATVDNITNLRITVPRIELPEIKIQASAAGAESGAVSTQAVIDEYCTGWFYFGFGKLRLCVKPIAYIDIGKLRMNNILLDAKVQKTIVKDVTIPMNLTGLIIESLMIKEISVPSLNLEKLTS